MVEPHSPSVKPRLWRLARIEFDAVRKRPVLLYPEGAMLLNETGAAILELCDGTRTIADISSVLGERYKTDVGDDVRAYLDALADRDLVVLS